METFRGKAHLPGADKEWNVQLEIDWEKKAPAFSAKGKVGGLNRQPSIFVFITN